GEWRKHRSGRRLNATDRSRPIEELGEDLGRPWAHFPGRQPFVQATGFSVLSLREHDSKRQYSRRVSVERCVLETKEASEYKASCGERGQRQCYLARYQDPPQPVDFEAGCDDSSGFSNRPALFWHRRLDCGDHAEDETSGDGCRDAEGE